MATEWPEHGIVAVLHRERDAWMQRAQISEAYAQQLAETLQGIMWKIDAYGSGWKPTQAEREAIAKALDKP